MDKHAPTIKTAGEYLYQVVVRGECGPVTQGLLGDVTIEASRGYTTIVFPDRDVSDLYGLLDRIQDLGLHLISIRSSAAVPRSGEAPGYRPGAAADMAP